MIEKWQGVSLIHVLKKLFIKSDINEHEKLLLRKKKYKWFIGDKRHISKSKNMPPNIAPELNNYHTIENMSL